MGTVAQIEQLVRIAGEFGRPIATAQQAREICRIGQFYGTVDETLAANGFAPNRNGAQQGFLRKADRKSTRLNSSHLVISYAVFCLKKKKKKRTCSKT